MRHARKGTNVPLVRPYSVSFEFRLDTSFYIGGTYFTFSRLGALFSKTLAIFRAHFHMLVVFKAIFSTNKLNLVHWIDISIFRESVNQRKCVQ